MSYSKFNYIFDIFIKIIIFIICLILKIYFKLF